MTPEAVIFRVLMALPAYSLEANDVSRAPRMALLAQELSRLDPPAVAGLIDIGRAESQFARYVAEGCFQVPKGAPDCDRRTALGYWQLKRLTCPAAWGFPPWTTESLREQVACSARLWQGAAWRCLQSQEWGCVWAAASWSASRYSVLLSDISMGVRR